MGAIAEMTQKGATYSDGLDAIVIRRIGAVVTGGRTLDMSGFTGDTLRAGHVIIREKDTDTYKPMPVSSGAYSTLPEGHEYKGVLVASTIRERPLASIMYDGEVNDKAMPYPLTDTMRTALKAAWPGLYFMHD